MPKYCKEYYLQGHNKSTCWNIHSKLHEEKMEEGRKDLNQQSEVDK